MAGSQRTPTTGQRQVMVVCSILPDTTTDLLHAKREELSQKRNGVSVGTVASTFENLRECHRHEWVEPRVTAPAGTNKYGEHIAWTLNAAGREALERVRAAMAAAEATEPTTNETKEEPVEAPTATPPAKASWDERATSDDPATPAPDEQHAPDPEALDELDQEPAAEADDEDETTSEEEVLEGEVEEDNPPVNEGSNQLSLAIGGPKPVESVLKIQSHQQSFGSTRQFKNLERIPVTAWLEIREVAAPVQDNGKVKRVHKARLTQIVFDADIED